LLTHNTIENALRRNSEIPTERRVMVRGMVRGTGQVAGGLRSCTRPESGWEDTRIEEPLWPHAHRRMEPRRSMREFRSAVHTLPRSVRACRGPPSPATGLPPAYHPAVQSRDEREVFGTRRSPTTRKRCPLLVLRNAILIHLECKAATWSARPRRPVVALSKNSCTILKARRRSSHPTRKRLNTVGRRLKKARKTATELAASR